MTDKQHLAENYPVGTILEQYFVGHGSQIVDDAMWLNRDGDFYKIEQRSKDGWKVVDEEVHAGGCIYENDFWSVVNHGVVDIDVGLI